MALKEALDVIRQALQDNSILGTRGECRTTPTILADVVKKSNLNIEVHFLAANDSSAINNHYALELQDGDENAVVNMDPTAGYPEYIGDIRNAPGFIRLMKRVPKIL